MNFKIMGRFTAQILAIEMLFMLPALGISLGYGEWGAVRGFLYTITLLAFVAAGMTAVYQMEQLPLPTMILLHGGALYVAYILTYLINGWLKNQLQPILIFTGIFIAGYALIWLVIYCIEKSKAAKLNKLLNKK
jgi:hypothetical protein